MTYDELSDTQRESLRMGFTVSLQNQGKTFDEAVDIASDDKALRKEYEGVCFVEDDFLS